jgi:hypothetical protein
MSTILITGKSIVSDPFFWTTVFALIINYFLYRINKRTFKILYTKPWIQIRRVVIQESKDGNKPHSLIPVYIINPSSYQNTIINYKLRSFMSGKIIEQGESDISLPQFGRQNFNYSLDYDETIKYKNKLVVLTLTDLNKRKFHKTFRLTGKNFST